MKRRSRLISFECLDALQADLRYFPLLPPHRHPACSGIHILVLAFSRDVNLGAILNQKLADGTAQLPNISFLLSSSFLPLHPASPSSPQPSHLSELAPGTLVVSWSRILDAQPEFERAAVYKVTSPSCCPADPQQVAVSWSDSWGMYVYRRKAS
eukprot:282471-Hanusia_phi.AAC.1